MVLRTMKKDPHELLGVKNGATKEEIKKAHKEKVFACHPDRNPDDPKAEEKLKDINEAYDILSGKRKSKSQGWPVSQPFGGAYTRDPFADFFYGQRGPSNNPWVDFGAKPAPTIQKPKKLDVWIDLKITFLEAVWGCKKKIRVKRILKCTTCKGNGKGKRFFVYQNA